MPTLAATALLDRVSGKRADADWIDGQRASAAARFMVLCDLKPVVSPGADRSQSTLKWLSRSDVTRLGLPETGAMLLGLSRDTAVPHFALAFWQHSIGNTFSALSENLIYVTRPSRRGFWPVGGFFG